MRARTHLNLLLLLLLPLLLGENMYKMHYQTILFQLNACKQMNGAVRLYKHCFQSVWIDERVTMQNIAKHSTVIKI